MINILQSHFRVTAALVVREMSARFGDKPGGYVWAMLDPVAHVLLMTVLYAAIARSPALGSSFPLFFATGYLAFQFYQAMSSYVASAVKANKALMNYPLVAPIDTVVARYILQLITTSLVAVCILGFIILEIPQFSASIDWPSVIEAAFAATLLGAGIGLVNVTLFVRAPLYEKIFSVFNRPMMLLSGVFFLPDAMPQPYGSVLLYNPVAHVIMWFRSGFYPEYRPAALDTGYVVECAFVLIFIGLALLSVSSAILRND